jgi:proline-rich AKT1 substrate 1
MKKYQIDVWMITKCLNCDVCVYAEKGDEKLINAELLNASSSQDTLKSDKNFSLPFKVILKPVEEESNIAAMKSSINNDPRIKCLFGKLQDFIEKDASEIQAEIRRLTLAMNERRQKAERDFQQIVTLINSIDTNNKSSTNYEQSTKLVMLSSDITPPVTPESAQLTIDDHHQMMSAATASPASRMSEANAKHGSVLQKPMVTRTINFDDDIFELDGMQDEAENDIDHYHKYSDTETSDVEEMAEKRPSRGRSGSACFARSAPISMPQFIHHAIHDDKRDTINENDIASSIKFLAKSIHNDSIFGEMPVRRPAMKHADF